MINQTNQPAHWPLLRLVAVLVAATGTATFTAAIADDDEDKRVEHREFIGSIDELRERIGELSRAGKREQAHELEEKIHEMMREHPEMAEQFHARQRNRENAEIQNEMRKLKAGLKRAMEVGNEDEAREIRKHMEEIQHSVRHRDESEHTNRRIHHLRQAAENLAAAGLHEQARELHEQAEETEAELRHHNAEARDEDLARHVQHLERELAELKEVVGNLREQMEKLNNQLRKAKGGERD